MPVVVEMHNIGNLRSTAGRGRHYRACAFRPQGGLASPDRRLTGKRRMGNEDFRTQLVRTLLHPGQNVG